MLYDKKLPSLADKILEESEKIYQRKDKPLKITKKVKTIKKEKK